MSRAAFPLQYRTQDGNGRSAHRELMFTTTRVRPERRGTARRTPAVRHRAPLTFRDRYEFTSSTSVNPPQNRDTSPREAAFRAHHIRVQFYSASGLLRHLLFSSTVKKILIWNRDPWGVIKRTSMGAVISGSTKWIPVAPDDTLRSYEAKRSVWLLTALSPVIHSLRQLVLLNEGRFVSLQHKTNVKSLGYICSNSQQYIVWVKIIIFILCQKSLGY